jgi:integrase
MATINFYYRGKSENSNLTIRLKHSTSIDYRISTKIVSKRSYWFNTSNRHLKLHELHKFGADAQNHAKELKDVSDEVLKRFKNDNNNGVPPSKEWLRVNLKEVVSTLSSKEEIETAQKSIDSIKLEQQQEEQDIINKNLVVSAIQNVIENKYYDNKDQQRIYNQALSKVIDYQNKKKVTVLTKDVTQNFIEKFTNFLINDLSHQISTANKHCKSLVYAVKYQKGSYSDDVRVSSTIRDIKYKKETKANKRKTRSEIVVTLSFDELDTIHKTEVPEKFLNAKKIILFGCEVGLRISDYNKLTIGNIKKYENLEYWSFWNKKTGNDIVIPITERIKKYIDIYGLPKTEYNKTADVVINREIKEVCKLAGINDLIQGRKSQAKTVNGIKTRRTISMKYPKSEIITTHSLRRSFATNYHNILTLFQIRQITGHTNDVQLLEYINQDKDRNDVLQQMALTMNTNQKERDNLKKADLKIVGNASNQN